MGTCFTHLKNPTNKSQYSNTVSLSNCNVFNYFSLVPEALSLQSLFVDGSKSIPGAKKFKNIDEMTAVVLQRRLETVHTSRNVWSLCLMLVWTVAIYLESLL